MVLPLLAEVASNSGSFELTVLTSPESGIHHAIVD